MQVNTTPYFKQTSLLNHNKENNTIMKLLTYKTMTHISGWLRVTKKYKNMPLSNTWRATWNTTQHTEPAQTLWPRLRICQNRISPPSLDVILAQVNCSDNQTRVSSENSFRSQVEEKG